MWERGEKPSVSATNRLGSSSSSSRLNSISNLTALDHYSRCDSISSSTSTGTSPLPLLFSTSTPIPLTPSSSQSLLSPSSPFTMALATSHTSTFTPYHTSSPSTTAHIVPVQTPPPLPTYNQIYPHGLNRSYSSSSSMFLEETPPPSLSRNHHSVTCLDNGRTPQGGPSSGGGVVNGKRWKRPLLTHKRSLSNPLSHIVLNQDEEDMITPTDSSHTSSNHVPTMSRSSLACYSYRSPSPPSRTGSQPSILSSGRGSPQSRVRHPQMRRISNVAPTFSQSISNDQLIPTTSTGNASISGSESILCRHGTWESPGTPRCNSMAGMSRQTYMESNLHAQDLTSASMVDLPVGGLYNGSREHLDRVEEGNLPRSSGKSQSVPRLTLMTVSMDNEKGQ